MGFSALARTIDVLRQEWMRSIIVITAVIVVGWLVLYPLGIMFEMGLRAPDGSLTLANFAQVFRDPGLARAFGNSLIVSTGATAIALLLAVPAAWAVSRTTMPGKQFFRLAILVAFVIPNFISAIAWILLLGPNAGLINVFIRDTLGIGLTMNIYSMTGLIAILGFSFYPLIFFAVAAALDNMDPSYEEAAQMSGASAWHGSFTIAMPLVLPSLVSSSVFVFLEAMGAFGAPAAIGNAAYFHTLTTKIYELFSYPPRFELAAAAATPIILLTILGLALQRYALGRRSYNVISGKATKARAVDIGWGRWIVFAYCCLVVFVTVVLPMTVLLRTSLVSRWGVSFAAENLTLRHYAVLFDRSTIVPNALWNTFLTSVVTATVCVLLALIIVWLVERTKIPGRSLLTFVSTVTFAFPGVALAVGFVLGYNSAPFALYGTIFLFFVAFSAHRFPFAFMFMRNSVKQLSTELEEAARMSGASWARSIIDVSIPLLKTGMLAAWIMVFAITLRELSMAILLYVRGTETLPIAIFSFVDNGTFEIAASMSVVLIMLSIVSVAALRWISGKSAMDL